MHTRSRSYLTCGGLVLHNMHNTHNMHLGIYGKDSNEGSLWPQRAKVLVLVLLSRENSF